jgi:hypothetical protein
MITPLYGQLSPLRVPTSMRFISNDADVVAYVLAVEAADGQRLEDGVISAYESFITGCKTDSIWAALKASCILAGARTLPGALVPLVGTAPTNNNFVSADYNRKTGLAGNGSTKNLNPNRNNNADPQNSKHFSFFSNTLGNTAAGSYYVGFGSSFIQRQSGGVTTRLNDGTNSTTATSSAGFLGISRSDSSSYVLRNNATNFVKNVSSTTNTSDLSGKIFSRRDNALYVNARFSFYSIGESINLAFLDTRVSSLMTDLAAAIP